MPIRLDPDARCLTVCFGDAREIQVLQIGQLTERVVAKSWQILDWIAMKRQRGQMLQLAQSL